MRKFSIGLISLVAVLAVYMLYGRIDKTPPINTDAGAQFVDTVADSNLGDVDSKTGMIGTVGIETVQKAKYIIYNKNEEVEREWGFERLLHEVRDIWEIEKPYMNFYQRNFKCYVTADSGKVRVETAVGKTTPKDATFTGNVVIHILPESSGKIKESRIFLDDIFFLSEKSQLSTTGPVKFVSEDVLMLGTGMELVYNDQLKRLEYLRLMDLESLRGKSSQMGFISSNQNQADTAGLVKTAQPGESVISSSQPKAQVATIQPQSEQEEGEYYKCVFNKNVVIDSPEQLVFAGDTICINDIFWSTATDSRPNEAEARTPETRQQSIEDADMSNVTVAVANEPNKPSEDIIVTCDGGFVVVPMDSTRAIEILAETDMETTRPPDKFNQAEGRTAFITRQINYNASTGDSIVDGASELKFYTGDMFQSETDKATVPVKVTSQKQVKFLSALNQVIFEDNCKCEMLRDEIDGRRQYMISGPKFTVDLLPSQDKQPSGSDRRIKHFTADGGVVKLATVKKADDKVLGGVEIKCLKCDYDTIQQLFVATGPGLIKLNNSDVPEPNSQTDKFSLNKPSWAIIENFQVLKYFLDKNQLIADAGPNGLLNVNYFPIVKGQIRFDQQATVTTAHVQANFIETAGEKLKLSTLTATGGISYKDRDKEFDGGKLFYDAAKSIVTVQGDELQPCRFNGVAVDAIEWDLKTDRVKFEITAPGAL